MFRYGMTIGFLFSAVLICAQEENTQFYLLRTGYLLEGSATLDDNCYTVQTPFGSMNVPAHNVEFVGKSKEDIYHYKRNDVDPTNSNALVRFAEWCISTGFTEEGIAEYQRAGQVAPNAAFAGLIRQRLETLQQPTTTNALSETPSETPAPANVPTVSRQLFENFVRRVQPVLVNRCVSTDCHGTSGNQQFKMGIPREPLGNTSTRNLQAVLASINLEYPKESPFLLALVTPHGGTKTALSMESTLYIQIVQWVQQVVKELHAEKVSNADPTKTSVKVATILEQFRPTSLKTERPNPKNTNPPEEFDPLDPHVFNEKYHREQKLRGGGSFSKGQSL